MKVKAKFPNNKFGFYGGQRRKDGDVFDLVRDKDYSESWMEKLEDKKKPGPKPGPKPKTEAGAE